MINTLVGFALVVVLAELNMFITCRLSLPIIYIAITTAAVFIAGCLVIFLKKNK